MSSKINFGCSGVGRTAYTAMKRFVFPNKYKKPQSKDEGVLSAVNMGISACYHT